MWIFFLIWIIHSCHQSHGGSCILKSLCLDGNFWCEELAKAKMEILFQPLIMCFFLYFLNPCRASFAETYWQKAWANGDCPGKPPAAHLATGAPAEGAGRSQKPTVTHTRYPVLPSGCMEGEMGGIQRSQGETVIVFVSALFLQHFLYLKKYIDLKATSHLKLLFFIAHYGGRMHK